MRLEYFSVETDPQKRYAVYLFSTETDIEYEKVRECVQSLIDDCDDCHGIELWLGKTDDLMHGVNITEELANMGYRCALCPSLLKEDKYNVIGVKGIFDKEEKEITFIANTDLVLVVDFVEKSDSDTNANLAKRLEALL